jgi:hypothetical protein
MTRSLLCFASRRNGQWEAICLDFDIAVSGRSFDDVHAMLNRAITTYVEDANNEAEPARRALLSRRAPWHVRLKHIMTFAIAALWKRNDADEDEIPFSVPCHA